MNIETVLRNAVILLEQMAEYPREIMDALSLTERKSLLHALEHLVTWATATESRADIADLHMIADAIHRLVERISGLRALLLPPDTDIYAEQSQRSAALLHLDGHEGPATSGKLLAMIQHNLELSYRELTLAAAESSDAPDSDAPFLNTRFDGVAANHILRVGQRVPLVIWVGSQIEANLSQSSSRWKGPTSRPFQFEFDDPNAAMSFTVDVHADPDAWTINAVETTLVLVPPGYTQQEAVFLVTARLPGQDKLYITVRQSDTGAVVQDIWIPVVAAAGDEQTNSTWAEAAEQSASGSARQQVSLPLDTRAVRPRSVRITMQNGRDPGSFLAVVDADLPHGRLHQVYTIQVSVNEVQNATRRLRKELEKVVYYSRDAKVLPFANLDTFTVEESLARQAAVPLADAGQIVWHMLFAGPRTPEQLKRLAKELRDLPHGSTMQIVMDSQQFILPWALLYDKPGPITSDTLDWSGFWGYRYIIDVLPLGEYPDPVIRDVPFPFTVLLNDEDNLRKLTTAKERFVLDELKSTVPRIGWGADAVQQILADLDKTMLLYCYCHGDYASASEMRNELAAESALFFSKHRRLRIADLRRLALIPPEGRPLIFINACEGATQEPYYYDGFMPFFIEEQHARGFIGTEVKAPQLLAHDFGIQFLQAFTRGQPVGEILWQLRRFYLHQHHNILAFNYTLYGLDEIRVELPSNGY